MKKLSIEQKARRYDEAIERAKEWHTDTLIGIGFKANLEKLFPELKENEDCEIMNAIKEAVISLSDSPLKNKCLTWLEKQGNKELVYFDEAEKEKSDFVGDGFIKCLANFLDFKEGETYWLEYISDDKYNVRSDNLLGKTYHITPCQLYTIFKKQTWLEKQGEQKSAEWSEEDEIMRKTIILNLKVQMENCAVPSKDSLNKAIGWFQKLKHQRTFVPSEEEMKALEFCLEHNIDKDGVFGSKVVKLYKKLKKLTK